MNSKSTNVYGYTNNREGRDAGSGSPYCGEAFTTFIDLTQGNHQTVEDCYVCCRPIEFIIETDGSELLRIDTFTDDESVL